MTLTPNGQRRDANGPRAPDTSREIRLAAPLLRSTEAPRQERAAVANHPNFPLKEHHNDVSWSCFRKVSY